MIESSDNKIFAELMESKFDFIEHFDVLFNNSFDFVFLIDGNLNILNVNKKVCKTLFLEKEKLISKNINEYLFNDEPASPPQDSYVVAGISQISKIITSDKTINVTVNNLELNEDQRLIIAKEEVNYEGMISTILENTPLSIVIFDKFGKFEFCNSHFFELWDLSKNDISNYNILEDEQLKSSGKFQQIMKVFSGKPLLFLEGYYDSLLEKGKGYQNWLETILFPIRDTGGNVSKVVVMHKDISDIKLAQEEIRIANDRAEEANRLKDTFLANLSHEIRTPLNAILGYSDLIADIVKNNLRNDENQFIESFRNGVKRLFKTLTHIMEISQIDSGDYPLNLKPLNLKAKITSTLTLIKQEADRKNIELNLQIDPQYQTVIADDAALVKVLNNLIENAVKFTHKGYVKIETYPNPKKTILFCSVKDTGIGISSEYLDQLFEPFSQEQIGFSRPFEGNGLGLALTKGFLDLMNSSITVESTKGVGSNFTFSLPIFNES